MSFRGLLLTLIVALMVAAPCSGITLRLDRDFGTSMGGRIKGKFTARVRDVSGAQRVDFFLDGGLVATDEREPFAWSFRTSDFPSGSHTITAVADFEGGESEEASMTVEFVDSFGKLWTYYVWGITIFVAGMIIFSLWAANRERQRPQGKTRCPQCGTVFERRWSPVHKGSAYRNTCPMCGKSFWAYETKEEKPPGTTLIY